MSDPGTIERAIRKLQRDDTGREWLAGLQCLLNLPGNLDGDQQGALAELLCGAFGSLAGTTRDLIAEAIPESEV